MATLRILALCLGSVLVIARAAPVPAAETQQKYTTKYDNVNLDAIMKNERLLRSYIDCLMDRGRCTPDGAELKRDIPDALKTGCSKCSAKQKAGTDKMIKFLIEKKPDIFREFERKYDPKGLFRQRYRAEAAKHGIKV